MAKRIVITIGDKVKKARQTLGLTQLELAFKSGVNPAVISRLERNKGNSSLASLHKIAPILGMTIDSLVGRSPDIRQTAKGKST